MGERSQGQPCVDARTFGLIAAAPVTAGHTRQARRSHAVQPHLGALREIDGGETYGSTESGV